MKRSFKAAGTIRELRINVCQYPEGSTISLTWSTRERGDEPTQGHLWQIKMESPKPVKSIAHGVNLAAWLARRALAGDWKQIR